MIQDRVAPDLKSLTAKVDSLKTQSAMEHDAVMKTLEAFRAEMRSEMAALKAINQVEVYRQVAPVSERLAVMEARKKWVVVPLIAMRLR